MKGGRQSSAGGTLVSTLAVGGVDRSLEPGPALAARGVAREWAAQAEEETFAVEMRLDEIGEVVAVVLGRVGLGDGRVLDDVERVELREVAQRLHGARDREGVEALAIVGVHVVGAGHHGRHDDTTRGGLESRRNAAAVREVREVERSSSMRWAIGAALIAMAGMAACIDDTVPGDLGMDAVGDASDDVDRVDAACEGAARPAPVGTSCVGTVENIPSRGANHVLEPTPISYVDNPPSSGDHRPAWAKWGEYDYLGPQRWVHNLEHGGIAFLYDPCVDTGTISALREYARGMPDDDSGAFRWVLTPYPGLGRPIAVVAWEWTWQSDCLDASGMADLEGFVNLHYRQAPEDFASDGSYSVGWMGR